MLSGLEITSTGKYLPSTIIPNSRFSECTLFSYNHEGKRVDRKTYQPEGIFDVTGIRERRMAMPNETVATMGYQAAKNALDKISFNPKDLDGIILATVTQRRNVPSGAFAIQHLLGVPKCKLVCDINGACAGFAQAVQLANSYSRDNPGNYLVVGSEHLTDIVDPTDINATLFGDGAGAVLLQPAREEKGIRRTYLTSETDDQKIKLISRDCYGHLRMPNGPAVLAEAVDNMVRCARDLNRLSEWACPDVYIFHQANDRILKTAEKRLSQPQARVFRTIHKYGNMSSATCPIALDETREEGLVHEGSKVSVISFGAGLVTAGFTHQF